MPRNEATRAALRAAVFAALCAVVTAMPAACGARTGLVDDGGEGEAPGPDPCEVPTCSDITRGVFRLFADDGTDVGWFFLFDAAACNGAPTHYFISLGGVTEGCRRHADIVVTEATPDLLITTADNHGGTVLPECGGEPDREVVTLRLEREGCGLNTYRLSLVNSDDGSPYTLEASAVRCRCEIGWPACGGPLPDEICGF